MDFFSSFGSQSMAIITTPTSLCFILGVVVLLARTLTRKKYNLPPAVPGLPILGNLLQLKEKKPHQTFARWAEKYGPIFSIRTGASTVVVLNSAEVAKEAMVTKFSSISTRKLSKALSLLTCNKFMVAMSDYGQFHTMVKRYILSSVLGPAALKRLRQNRDHMIENVLSSLHTKVKDGPLQEVNLRQIFSMELFGLSLKDAIGKDVPCIYVDELGIEIPKKKMFQYLVTDPMKGAIDVDWRDFFPYLRWIPNPRFERRIHQFVTQKMALTKALINEQKKRIASGEAVACYLDYLLSEKTSLPEEQLVSLIWEAIIESSDTTMVVTEWAMFELAKNPECQQRLYREIQDVCGSQKITEEHIASLPYLTAIFHETLRFYPPVTIPPLRYVHEDIHLGEYDIPAGTEIAINFYGCNMNKNDWDEPQRWNPERFLAEKYQSLDLQKTMAFGAGKRVCAGAMKALLISCVSVGRFVQEFEWELKEGEEAMVDMVQLTAQKLHPMLAHIKPR